MLQKQSEAMSLEEFKKRLKRGCNILEIVQRYTTLNESHQGNCPFHEGDQQSLSVNFNERTIHCDLCMVTPLDLIAFLMKIENTTLSDTIERLAQEMSLPMPRWSEKETQAYAELVNQIGQPVLVLGQKIRQRRKTCGLTQLDVAQSVGTTDAYISAIEHGHKMPSYPTTKAIAETLKFKVDELYSIVEAHKMTEAVFKAKRKDHSTSLEGLPEAIPASAIHNLELALRDPAQRETVLKILETVAQTAKKEN